ncbi:MAG: stage V sporulation protein AE [Bacillota bacterium]
MDFVLAFVVGGLVCVAAQLMLDLTRFNPALVMVTFVSLGAIASGLGLYGPLVDLAGAGASIPLPNFGHMLVEGIAQDVDRLGFLGIFSGGLRAAAVGLTVAIVSSYLMALLFTPKG